MDGGTSKMQTGKGRYKGSAIKTRKPDLKQADFRQTDLRHQVSERVGASANTHRSNQEYIYNREDGFNVDDRFIRPHQDGHNQQKQDATVNQNQQSHTQHLNQLSANIEVANQNAATKQSSIGKQASRTKNILKGIAIILWSPFSRVITAVKRSYTHMSLRFEQSNLFNTSLRSIVNSVLVAVLIFTAAILYRNGQIAVIKHDIIEKIGEWSGAAGVSVNEVKLYNRQHSSKKEILDALNVKIGTPLLSFDVEAAKARIEKIGWVAEAEVQTIFPDRLEIKIIEREPFAIWQIDGKHHLVDRNGVLVADKVLHGYHLLPLIVGEGAATEALGLLSALEERPEIFEHIRALVRVGKRRWDMDLKNGIHILLPAEKPESMLADLERMILDQDIFSRGINIIDFRLKDRVRFGMDDATAKAYLEAKQELKDTKK